MAKSTGRAPVLDCSSLSSVALLNVPNGTLARLRSRGCAGGKQAHGLCPWVGGRTRVTYSFLRFALRVASILSALSEACMRPERVRRAGGGCPVGQRTDDNDVQPSAVAQHWIEVIVEWVHTEPVTHSQSTYPTWVPVRRAINAWRRRWWARFGVGRRGSLRRFRGRRRRACGCCRGRTGGCRRQRSRWPCRAS